MTSHRLLCFYQPRHKTGGRQAGWRRINGRSCPLNSANVSAARYGVATRRNAVAVAGVAMEPKVASQIRVRVLQHGIENGVEITRGSC